MTVLYEGKAKKLFPTDHPHELQMRFKDDATAFDGKKKDSFADKGRVNTRLTVLLFQLLEKAGISTHLIREIDPDTLLVRKVEIVPIEVVVRNKVTGSLARRSGLPEGHILKTPIVEFYYKNDDLGDPMITREHIREMDLATPGEVEEMRRQGLRINELLTNFFDSAGIDLIDFKVEFGRDLANGNRIILADEISPDTCRFWDKATGKKLDKDRFRQDLGDLMEGYGEVLNRVEHALHG